MSTELLKGQILCANPSCRRPFVPVREGQITDTLNCTKELERIRLESTDPVTMSIISIVEEANGQLRVEALVANDDDINSMLPTVFVIPAKKIKDDRVRGMTEAELIKWIGKNLTKAGHEFYKTTVSRRVRKDVAEKSKPTRLEIRKIPAIQWKT